MTPDERNARVTGLHFHVHDMAVALALWAQRNHADPQPAERRAASAAVDHIDAALRALHDIRGHLTAEIRRSDDATAARVDKLLAELRGEEGQA